MRRQGEHGLVVIGREPAPRAAESDTPDHETFGRVRAAVLRLFAEKAFHHVGMREIASATGYGMATLYKLADAKDRLVTVCLTPDFAELADRLTQVSRREVGARRRFQACLATMAGFDLERPAFARIVRVTTPPCLWDGTDQAERIAAVFEEIFRHGQRDGSVRADHDSRELASSVIALVGGLLARWAAEPETADETAAARRGERLASLLWPTVSAD